MGNRHSGAGRDRDMATSQTVCKQASPPVRRLSFVSRSGMTERTADMRAARLTMSSPRRQWRRLVSRDVLEWSRRQCRPSVCLSSQGMRLDRQSLGVGPAQRRAFLAKGQENFAAQVSAAAVKTSTAQLCYGECCDLSRGDVFATVAPTSLRGLTAAAR